MNQTEILAKFETVKAKAATEWGGFRRWLSANPLTGFWTGVVGGVLIAVVSRFV